MAQPAPSPAGGPLEVVLEVHTRLPATVAGRRLRDLIGPRLGQLPGVHVDGWRIADGRRIHTPGLATLRVHLTVAGPDSLAGLYVAARQLLSHADVAAWRLHPARR